MAECNGLYGSRGEITKYESTSDYVMVEGDATPAYASAKTNLVLRRWIYLRPDWIVVQDRVRLNKPNLPVRVVYHSVDQPQFDQSLQVVEGVLNQGGVFRSPATKRVTINRGVLRACLPGPGDRRAGRRSDDRRSQCLRRQLAAELSTGGRSDLQLEPVVRVLDRWTQLHSGLLRGPGGHRQPERRSGEHPWRLALRVPVTGTGEVNITTLIHVTAAGLPTPMSRRGFPLPQGISIGVRNGGDEFHLALCTPGVECDGMGYTH
ncbi:MAG: hypothetical protein R3E12_18225 [Candidatus Eisenbacteria bacterium]